MRAQNGASQNWISIVEGKSSTCLPDPRIELGGIFSPDTPSNAFHLPNGTGEKAHLGMFLFVAFLSDAVNDSTRTHRRCTTEPDPDDYYRVVPDYTGCLFLFSGGHIRVQGGHFEWRTPTQKSGAGLLCADMTTRRKPKATGSPQHPFARALIARPSLRAFSEAVPPLSSKA